MSLGIYSKPHPDYKFSSLSPFRVTFHGRVGGIQDQLVFVRNDDILRAYTSVWCQAVDTLGTDIVSGVNERFEWKMASKQVPLTLKEWEFIAPANKVSLGDLGSSSISDIKTFLPLWIRVSIPSRQPVNNITDVVLRLTATEILV